MGRGKHKPVDRKARKAKYTAQFSNTEENKKHNVAKMRQLNPNWPKRKEG